MVNVPKVTIILPCLNVEKYIKQCIESVINQTLKDIEILVIDAGSTDGTCKILESYTRNDPRVRVIQSEKKSYGYQVNMGISIASGQYIGIVDSDDRVALDMYEVLYDIALATGGDYVKGSARGFFTISEKLTYYYKIAQFSEREYVNGQIEVKPKHMPELLTKDNFLWYGIYRNSFLKKIRLHESPGAAFQDLGGLLQTQINAEKAIYVSKPFYEYRQDNVYSSGYNKEGFGFIKNEYAFAASFIDGKSEGWKKSFYYKMFLHIMDRFYAMAASGEVWEQAKRDIQDLSEKMKEVVDSQIVIRSDFSDADWENLQLLLESPEKLHDNCLSNYLGKKNALQQILKWIDNKKIIIFGGGHLGTFLHAQILYRGLNNVVAYCDNAVPNPEEYIYDVPVMKPQKAVATFKDIFFIIANKKHTNEMKHQLISLGVQENSMISYDTDTDVRLFFDK